MEINKNDKYKINVFFPSGNGMIQTETAILELKTFFKKCGLEEVNSLSSEDLNIILSYPEKGIVQEGSFCLNISPSKREIKISGCDEEGIRCGIIYLLELFGVRYFRPDSPALEEITLPIKLDETNQTFSPSFPYRCLHICAGKHHYDEKVAEWMSHLKMNRKLTHHNEADILKEELQKWGLKPDTTVHSYSFWIPDNRYFEQHPEYFALIGGKRVKQSEGGQLCLSNQQMRTEFIQNILKYIKEHPDISIVGIPPNDGYGWCECENCKNLDTQEDRKNGSVNGRVADFINDIANKVKEVYSNVLVGHYSYSNFSDFYQVKDVLPDNLIVSCTVWRCYKHSIGDLNCPINKPIFERIKQLKSKIKHIYIYDYYIYNWDFLPAPIWQVVAQDIKYYHQLGLDGFLSEVSGVGSKAWETFHLPIYVTAMYLWNINTNLDNTLNDYCQKNFGPADSSMRRYLDCLEKGLKEMDGCFTKKTDDFKKMFTKEIQKECLGNIENALKESKNFPEYYQRVNKEKELFDYWIHIFEEREKYCSQSEIKSFPLSQMNIETPLQKDPSTLVLVDKITLIPPEKNQTLVKVYSDNKEIGFIIECQEEEMENLTIHKGNDVEAVYGSDCIEIFIAYSQDAKTCYHFIINPDNFKCASECDLLTNRWNWSWQGNYQTETKKFPDRWVINFRIPKKEVGIEGNKVYFMIVRNRKIKKWEITLFPGVKGYFNPKSYSSAILNSDLNRVK